jgi:hypothetical protein
MTDKKTPTEKAAEIVASKVEALKLDEPEQGWEVTIQNGPKQLTLTFATEEEYQWFKKTTGVLRNPKRVDLEKAVNLVAVQ